jgi:NADH-quinone oxidoreductase subunit K
VNAILLAGPNQLAPYLVVAAILFAAGVLACTTRRNAVGYLMGIELMLNAGMLNTVAYGRFRSLTASADGQMLSLFVIALAAAEAAVALALVYAVFRNFRDVDLEHVRQLRS